MHRLRTGFLHESSKAAWNHEKVTADHASSSKSYFAASRVRVNASSAFLMLLTQKRHFLLREEEHRMNIVLRTEESHSISTGRLPLTFQTYLSGAEQYHTRHHHSVDRHDPAPSPAAVPAAAPARSANLYNCVWFIAAHIQFRHQRPDRRRYAVRHAALFPHATIEPTAKYMGAFCVLALWECEEVLGPIITIFEF